MFLSWHTRDMWSHVKTLSSFRLAGASLPFPADEILAWLESNRFMLDPWVKIQPLRARQCQMSIYASIQLSCDSHLVKTKRWCFLVSTFQFDLGHVCLLEFLEERKEKIRKITYFLLIKSKISFHFPQEF